MSDVDVTLVIACTIDGVDVLVRTFSLDEALSTEAVLRCQVYAPDRPVLARDVVGKDVVFSIAAAGAAASRFFVGTVVSAERSPRDNDVELCEIEARPPTFRLAARTSCRTFLEKSPIDIAKDVLRDAGIPDDAQDWRGVTGGAAVRPYVAQYRESDLAFLLRLLGEEGIYFATAFDGEKATLRFTDHGDGLDDAPDAELSFRPDFGKTELGPHAFRVTQAVAVRSDKVATRDYDPAKPSLALDGAAVSTIPGDHVLETYVYPARVTDPGIAKQRAQTLLESIEADRDVIEGESGSLGLAPGFRFTLTDHPYEPLSRAHLVVASRISGAMPRAQDTVGPSMRIWFRAVPTTTVYRAPRVDPQRVAPGLASGFVTGAPGEAIHVSAHGEVKARFVWDRSGEKSDKSSHWMRTSQIPTGGSMLLPRVGWEVSVVHLEGDIDRPLVIGRLYNGETPPPYDAEKEHASTSSLQTATTPGDGTSNEMRIGDAAGSEEMMFNASRDMSVTAKNNVTEYVGNDHKKKVAGNSDVDVTNSLTRIVGSNQALTVSGNQDTSVETFSVDQVGGNLSLSIGGNRDMKVGGDHKREIAGASAIDVGGNQIDLVVGRVDNKTLGSMTHDVGAAMVDISLGQRSLVAGGSHTEDTGLLKLVAANVGRGVEVGGSLTTKVAGAIVNKGSGDKVDGAGATYTEIAAGAELVKAANVVYEADTMLALVMGGSIVVLMPAMATFIGLSIKLDGNVDDLAALILDN